MARISFNKAISETLVKRFTGLARGDSAKSIAKALSGGGQPQSGIREGLRMGARTFATAIQGLNTGITFLNASKDTLSKLGTLTDKMIGLAERAASASIGRQQRLDADVEFRRMANEFKKTVKASKLGDREFMTLEGISEYLTVLGLDREKSDSIAAVFKQFVVSEGDNALASEKPQGDVPLRIPPGAYTATSRVTQQYSKIFDDNVTISTRPNAYKVLNDLKGLREQIDQNREVLDEAIGIVGKNIDLVRAAGFAFLELSDQIGSEAEADDVAKSLRLRIRKDAPAALSQAENLESIVVAALALDIKKLGIS